MYGRRYDRQKPGDPIAAKTINRPIGGLEALQRARYAGGLLQQMGPGGIPLVSGGVAGSALIRTVQTPTGGIPAASGTTPGQATCTLYTFNGTSLVLATETATVYNDQAVAFDGNRKVKAGFAEGAWWALVEECAAQPLTHTCLPCPIPRKNLFHLGQYEIHDAAAIGPDGNPCGPCTNTIPFGCGATITVAYTIPLIYSANCLVSETGSLLGRPYWLSNVHSSGNSDEIVTYDADQKCGPFYRRSLVTCGDDRVVRTNNLVLTLFYWLTQSAAEAAWAAGTGGGCDVLTRDYDSSGGLRGDQTSEVASSTCSPFRVQTYTLGTVYE